MVLNAHKKALIILIVSLVLAIVVVIVTINIVNTCKVDKVYKEAEEYVYLEQYQKSIGLFETIKESNYKDTEAYIYYCKSHIDYDEGKYMLAYYDYVFASFKHLTNEQSVQLNAFSRPLREKFQEYLNRTSNNDQKDPEANIQTSVPFVGMPESKIRNTILGSPSNKVRHNTSVSNGKILYANLYDFIQNGKVIFTARCIDGVVTQVFDFRDNPTYPNYRGTGSGIKDSELNVSEFSHPEDFYHWYKDYFYDYEEAEEYYYSHGGR